MTNNDSKQYEQLDRLIKELSEIRESIEHLTDAEATTKKAIQDILIAMNTETYKNDIGTLSLKTNIKYSYDEDEVIKYLKQNEIVLYLDVEPRIKSSFDKDLRAGKLQGGWPKDIPLEKVETQTIAFRINTKKDESPTD